ncbi:TetR/AcrR family transcriptional regulator [Nonomuraea basaltis]|uniref:TetR/AcrR family transcriptional regulator n=1 Tax=Nonomuraea basaltis TaxID=2495887 RepID=UPI00110C3FBB|nr:TetR/AcrR family transcriptional regulator C-terminal domain-containing protein [Nonomuraea basaltis]TMR87988.1 TetR family transcriptional regulator [Nonomuraea basaltis]
MGRPPHRLLDRETIIRAGLDLVDEHGAEALSVNRVATALGVKGPSLYNYITGRDDLVEGIRDLIVAEMRLDFDIHSWTAMLEAWAHSYRDAFAAHPRALPLLAVRTIQSPAALGAYAAAFARLRGAGWPEDRLLPLVWAVEYFVVGSVLAPGPPTDHHAATADRNDPPPGLEPLLQSGPEQRELAFEAGLAALVRGFSAELAEHRARLGRVEAP